MGGRKIRRETGWRVCGKGEGERTQAAARGGRWRGAIVPSLGAAERPRTEPGGNQIFPSPEKIFLEKGNSRLAFLSARAYFRPLIFGQAAERRVFAGSFRSDYVRVRPETVPAKVRASRGDFSCPGAERSVSTSLSRSGRWSGPGPRRRLAWTRILSAATPAARFPDAGDFSSGRFFFASFLTPQQLPQPIHP